MNNLINEYNRIRTGSLRKEIYSTRCLLEPQDYQDLRQKKELEYKLLNLQEKEKKLNSFPFRQKNAN